MRKTILLVSSLLMLTSCGSYRWKKKLKRMDTSGDGKISKTEWDDYFNKKFQKKDKDNDGFITEKDCGCKSKS